LLDAPQRVVAEFLDPTCSGSGLRRGRADDRAEPSAAQ
jgi:hypothetical protein